MNRPIESENVPHSYLQGISQPKQRAFLEAYVQVVIGGTDAAIADACRKAGIWRGTPARWHNNDRRFVTAFVKAQEIAYARLNERIRREVAESWKARDPEHFAAVHGHR